MPCWGPPHGAPRCGSPLPSPCSVCCSLPLGTGQELFISHIVSCCCCCRGTRSPHPHPSQPPRLPPAPSPQRLPPWGCSVLPAVRAPLATAGHRAPSPGAVPLSPPAIPVCSAPLPGTMTIPCALCPYRCPPSSALWLPNPLAPALLLQPRPLPRDVPAASATKLPLPSAP